MVILLIGIILISGIVGKTYTHVYSNNCSQIFFDETTLNYMASFKFISENFDRSCPNVKAVAFRKDDLPEVEMRIEIVENIWRSLNKEDKFLLLYQLRKRLHYSCNNKYQPKELCRTENTLDGGVSINLYDGSKRQFQKSCSICLLKNPYKRYKIQYEENQSPILHRVNLSLFNFVDKEFIAEARSSVKFLRTSTEKKESPNYFLRSIMRKSFPYQNTLISDSVTYYIQVSLLSGGSHINAKKVQNLTNECLFRCDWSSTCLSSAKSICDKIVDCQYGDDEDPTLCQLYNKCNRCNQINSSVDKIFHFNAVHSRINQNEDYLRFLIPVIFSVVVLVLAGIGIMIFYRRNKQKDIISKKISDISIRDFSRIHKNSMYLQKSSLDHLTHTSSLQEMFIGPQSEKNFQSGLCAAGFHQKYKDDSKQSIHPKSFRKQERSDRYSSEQYSNLCEQINYPDTRTRSNWLRTYFQLSRSNNTKIDRPPVLNVSHLPPVSFSCKL